ncbi:hypothetical protein WR25_00588 [Diploscapter pachys]|uniref:glutathione gamma-glutamylcysteinyltransferase n=1 Tax=Diploscapter pachys TaxID=2018661 RepID=A0A2A2JK77_9BILA|nr:hypothetical protein WR25_00588 [Diploscapter pachys]
MSVTAKNFYRRSLPESCIDFSSEAGKKMFTESLLEGNANIYFKLAAHFRTQDEPAYCGLSTLVMVLNSLEVDPGRVWKSPWRYYHESMLDCCVPLENVKKTGINLPQFGCLATCNRLQTVIYTANDTDFFLNRFRENLIKSVRSDTDVVVASYDRAQLDQTGSGHFSPLAAYHSATDSVLIMDVARFKYPPHWVTLKQLRKSMCSIENTTKKPRDQIALITKLFQFAQSVISWKNFLLEEPISDPTEELQLVCRRFAQCFADYALCCTQKNLDQQQQLCKKEDSFCKDCIFQHSEACKEICAELRKTPIAQIFGTSSVAALMLAWPYEIGCSTRNDRLAEMAREKIELFSADTRNEINQLHIQIQTLMCCSRPPPNLDRALSIRSNNSGNSGGSSYSSENGFECTCGIDTAL